MPSPMTMVQLRCPICEETIWAMDCIVRGPFANKQREPAFPERFYVCRHCDYEGAGFVLLQAAPSTFLLQPHDQYPMGRKAFRHWVEILREHFPNHPNLPKVGREFQPNMPSLRQQVAAALMVIAFILDKSKPDARHYGEAATALDRVCLPLLFEHHVRKEYGYDAEDTVERLKQHIDGESVEILSYGTLQQMVLPVFDRARKVADRRPMIQDWNKDAEFGFGVEVLNRFGHQEVCPPMLPPEKWRLADTRELSPDDARHRPLTWPLESLL